MPPYLNSKQTLTHFICVAPCEELLKDKYLFALTIKTPQQPTIENDNNYLSNPYIQDQTSIELGLSVQQRMIKQN